MSVAASLLWALCVDVVPRVLGLALLAACASALHDLAQATRALLRQPTTLTRGIEVRLDMLRDQLVRDLRSRASAPTRSIID